MYYTDVLDAIIVVILVVGCRQYDMSCSMKYSWFFTMSHSQSAPSHRLKPTTKN